MISSSQNSLPSTNALLYGTAAGVIAYWLLEDKTALTRVGGSALAIFTTFYGTCVCEGNDRHSSEEATTHPVGGLPSTSSSGFPDDEIYDDEDPSSTTTSMDRHGNSTTASPSAKPPEKQDPQRDSDGPLSDGPLQD